MSAVNLEDLVSLCKRRGFFYQSSEIYGGLAGVTDFGPLGVALKRNLCQSFWRTFVDQRADIYGLDSGILMNAKVWQASGHVDGFIDPLVEDVVTKQRFRADHLLEEQGIDTTGFTLADLEAHLSKHQIKSPDGNDLSKPRRFNLMFETQIGAVDKQSATVYLRPETAQGIFVNFKNVVDSFQPDLPFGIAQIGKGFRNEISPRDFIFRAREFEMMEIEYFCTEGDWATIFENFRQQLHDWFISLGLSEHNLHDYEVPASDRAHYSQRTIDIEFDYSFGRKELCGLAYRTDYDLRRHQEVSGKNIEYIDKQTNQKILPVCVEPSVGVERLCLAILQSAYRVDDANQRTYLALPEQLAPIRYAVSPLVANKPALVKEARRVFDLLLAKYGSISWDAHGNIGKRYRRQDEIGTPWCVTIDFQTLEDGTVTRRHRDTLEQQRLAVDAL